LFYNNAEGFALSLGAIIFNINMQLQANIKIVGDIFYSYAIIILFIYLLKKNYPIDLYELSIRYVSMQIKSTMSACSQGVHLLVLILSNELLEVSFLNY